MREERSEPVLNDHKPKMVIFDRRMIEARNYWVSKLSQRLDASNLPLDYVRPASYSRETDTIEVHITEDVYQKLMKLTNQKPFLLYATLMAALKICVHKYTGSSSITVGSPARRQSDDSGEATNALAIVDEVSDRLPFRQFLLNVRTSLLDAYTHQHYPFDYVVRDVGMEHVGNKCPLFDIALVLKDIHGDMPEVKNDITFTFMQEPDRLTGYVAFKRELFAVESIKRFSNQFVHVLRTALENTAILISELPILTATEQQQILEEWNATRREYPEELCIHQLFEAQVERTPNATAVLYAGKSLTYRELNQRANQLAHHLQSMNVGPDVLVGLCVERSLEMMVGLLGILKAGGAYIPLDPTYPEERLAFMIRDAQVGVLVTQQRLEKLLTGSGARLVLLDGDHEELTRQNLTNPISAVSAANLAYAIYTSGSTGQPKGVMIPHQGLVNYLLWCTQTYAVEQEQAIPVHSSLSFDLTITSLFLPLLVGGYSILLPEERGVEALGACLRTAKSLSLIKITPAHLELLSQQLKPHEAAGRANAFIIGGEALRQEHLSFWRTHAPQTRFINEYGPTETVVGCCIYEVAQEDAFTGLVPIGRPIANAQLYLLDKHLHPVSIGVTGELYIGGNGLARGYLNRPELTAERFVPHPYSSKPGACLYRTGDLARYRADGIIEFIGRNDQQVKVRGFRIELGEIETVLTSHPAVLEAVVLVREELPGEKRLVAYAVPMQAQSLTSSELRSYLQEKLPEYMVPTAFVLLEAMPLTTNGKVDRHALLSLEQAQAGGTVTVARPRTPIEEVLLGIWAEVLGQPQVSIHDNFFELGGHSLLATQALSRVRDALQVELPLHTFFQTPTVADLAEYIEATRRARQELAIPLLLPALRQGKLPLSFAQQRLWFLDQLEPGSPFYNVPIALHLRGKLHVQALEQTLNELVRRHESLRTTFGVQDGQPVQVITSVPHIKLPVIDLREYPEGKREVLARRLITQEARQAFDLTRGPLVRAVLLQQGDEEQALVLTMHHIVADAWSMGVLFQELATLYTAFAQGKPSPLPELSIQYADFALWQRQWLQGEVLATHLAYWKQQLRDAPTLLSLPTDRPRPALQTFHGATESFTLSVSLSQAIRTLSRREGTTVFMTLLAAFQTLLYRSSGQEDILVGSPIANRTRSELESLIGFFANTLVLRTQLSGEMNFREVLGKVREAALQGYEHQDLPFEQLVEELQPQRDLSHSPLFQVVFTFQNAPIPPLELPGLTLRLLDIDWGTAKFDLTLDMVDTEQGLMGSLQYNTDLFDVDTITRLIEHFQVLLEAAVAHPEQRIVQLPLLSANERQQLLVEWNATKTEYPREQCIHYMFEAQAERTPDAVAIASEDIQVTYQELNRLANQLASYLQKQGVGPESLVGLCMERSVEMLVGLFGVLKAGAAYVPLAPTSPQKRLAFMIADAQVSLLLTQQRLTGLFYEQRIPVLCLDKHREAIATEEGTNLARNVRADNLCYVIYTSGSTGQPKGVLVPHQGLCNLVGAQTQAFDVQPTGRVLQFASLSFDASISEILMALLTGAVLYLGTQDAMEVGQPLLRLLREQAITTVTLPPSVLALQPLENLPTLHTIISAGETCSAEIVARWAEGRQFLNAYGPTEATVCATIAFCNDPSRKPSIGRPITNVATYILDTLLQPVPVGIPGELYISGVGLTRGYLKCPELTAERFVPHPYSDEPGARLYRTGDLARYLADGTIEFIGRNDQQVKVRGFRIELGEVEAALTSHLAVREAIVLVREDSPGDKRLVAYVVAMQAQSLTSSELRSYLQEKLPDYMIPTAFVQLEAMPLTTSGKVDRRALPSPEQARTVATIAMARPRTPIEEVLLGIWAEVLGRSPVSIHDNFFDLGGHSLLATQALSWMRDALQVELPLHTFFQTPTVADLAKHVEAVRRAGQNLSTPPLRSAQRQEGLPLSFAQQRLWFLDQLEPGSSFYNVPIALHLRGQLHVQALEQSLNELVRRHEALRTMFVLVEGNPTQVIATTALLNLTRVDLREYSQTEQEVQAKRLITQVAHLPFDLAHGPLIRAVLIQQGDEEQTLVLIMHHIVADAWSIGVLFQELATLYTAFTQGKPSPLSELPIQYADFTLWQRQWLQGEVLATHLTYWKHQLHGAPPLLSLPTDRPRPALQTFHGATESFTLSISLSQSIRTLSRREGTTMFMTLLAAFQTLLYRSSGQEDILVGSPIANRTRSELEGLIGFFANTLVLRTQLLGELSFREVLGKVRETALQGYAHQDLPFEQLVEELQPRRDLSHSPLFQAMFTFQNAPIPPLELPGLTLRLLDIDWGTAKFDLTLTMTDSEQGLSGDMEYNTDLFDAGTITRMIEHFQALLEAVAAHPEQPLAQIPLLSASEQQQLLVEWNTTGTEYPRDLCIHHLFEAQVERTPDTIAAVFEDEQLTYRELNQRANRLAHFLRKQGIASETLVALCVERSVEMLVGLLGILKAGAAYVPLDPTSPEKRLAFMIADAQISLLLTQQQKVELFSEQRIPILCLDKHWEAIATEEAENPVWSTSTDNLCYVIYTSGSTGQPKGVQVPHHAAVNFLTSMRRQFELLDQDILLAVTTLSFDIAALELFLPLTGGARVVILGREAVSDGVRLAEQIRINKATIMQATPVTWRLLLEAGWQGSSQLKILCGGEALSLELANHLLERGAGLWNLYGPTETTIWSLAHQVEPRDESVYIGRPIANTQVYLLDSQLQPVSAGTPGEVYIGGAGVARGYHNRPELTAERFVPHPFSAEPGARLYRTGDLARYRANGIIEYLGRMDFQVKIHGFRIELGEIEAALNQHPAIQETVVLVREDVSGDKRLVAYVIAHSQQLPSASELRNYLKISLPEYMVPSTFVALETFPLTPSGKVDRRTLLTSEGPQLKLEVAYTAPQTEVEQVIAAIWQEVLHVERMGIHDNFFDLGGHSLLVARVHSKLREFFDKEITLVDLFRYPTISSLADYIGQRQSEEGASFQNRSNRAETHRLATQRQRQRRQRHQETKR